VGGARPALLGGMVAHAVLEGGHKVVPEDLQHNDLRRGGMRRQPVYNLGAVPSACFEWTKNIQQLRTNSMTGKQSDRGRVVGVFTEDQNVEGVGATLTK